MLPSLSPGDWALAVAASAYRRGDVVVVQHPGRPDLELVKRVSRLPGELTPDGRVLGPDEFWIEGDRPEASTDSRSFGPVRLEHLKARVCLVYWPFQRRRRL